VSEIHITYTISARPAGKAISDVTGNWASGMIDQVHDPDEEEQRHHEGDVLLAVLLADDLVDDAAAHEVVTGLADHLQLAGDQLGLVEGGPEEPDDHDGAEDGEQHRLGQLDAGHRRDGLVHERVQPRRREATSTEDVAIRVEGKRLVSTHRGLLQRGA
jgi:hypothetical protein